MTSVAVPCVTIGRPLLVLQWNGEEDLCDHFLFAGQGHCAMEQAILEEHHQQNSLEHEVMYLYAHRHRESMKTSRSTGCQYSENWPMT